MQAVDAVTGDRIWEYRRIFENKPDENFRNRMRSLAIYGRNIHVTTPDAYMIALDARTGDVVWEHAVADHRLGYRYTSGAIVVEGRIVAGITGCERYKNEVCFISAHDPDTGRELWRRSTIAAPGEAGGDTWGDLPLTFRQSGEPLGAVATAAEVHGRPTDVQESGGFPGAAAPVQREQDTCAPRLTTRRGWPSQPPFQGVPVIRAQLEVLGRLHASDGTRIR